jgi:group II intron reverse transcriptase/maturase
MRRAAILLNIIRERGKRGLPVNEIYRTLYQVDLYLLAYSKLYKNEGSMTKGVTTETVDGMSLEKINKLIESVRFERYRWTPVRRIYIPKKGDKNNVRPLGLPTYSDKMLQEVIRLILEAYYEPQFSETSHGFRPGRGCHTALLRVTQKGHGTKWFIEGDIKKCFDRIDHTVLLNILKKDFKDNRFITLIERLLQAGYLEDWVYHKTYSGVPQGSIASPILTNLVMNKLDQFMEKEMIPQFHKGDRRKVNPEYSKITLQAWNAKKSGELEQARTLNKIAQTMPSRVPNDPNFKRLWYVRYADDWLAGVIGTKTEAQTIKTKVADYLKHELKLELSEEKTLVTHARNEKAKFLGYEVQTLHCDTKHTDGQRSINGSIGLTVPHRVIKENRAKYMRNGKPIHRPERLKDDPYSIINQYQMEYKGVVQYYRMAYNLHKLGYLKYTMEVSLVKTLANKYKTTCNKTYRKYATTLTIPEGTYKVLQVIIPRTDKKPLETHFGAVPLIWNKWAHIDDDREVRIWSKRSEVVQRLLAEQCELCGKKESIEMHHIRKMADIQSKNGKPVAEWKRAMSMRRRKSLAVCRGCHEKIHKGEYNGPSLRRKSTGEPFDIERVTRGSGRGS